MPYMGLNIRNEIVGPEVGGGVRPGLGLLFSLFLDSVFFLLFTIPKTRGSKRSSILASSATSLKVLT